jgi:hypothetical protein
VQHRDPSLSPPLPPLPDLSTDYVTSSEEEWVRKIGIFHGVFMRKSFFG